MNSIKEIMEYETAGDPITGLKWTKKTTEKIADKLSSININVCSNTVGKILKKMGFSLKGNYKNTTNGGKKLTTEETVNRDSQFNYIENQRTDFSENGYPVISVDTKKKELIGNFKNNGVIWCEKSISTNDHDFPSYAIGKGIPFGIYNTLENTGRVFVGTTRDTAEFAVDSIKKWWQWEGMKLYSSKSNLLILADSGGSNSCRSRLWKMQIQKKLCDKLGLKVTICHYPTGASKWNPIEHRLFSEITKNWAGHPLIDYKTMLNYISTTKTETGLTVKAHLITKEYETGKKVNNAEWETLNIKKHETFPLWNYTIFPN